MHISRRTAIALLVIAALAGSATTAISALGSGGSDDVVFKSTLVPSDPGDPAIQTVPPGSVPWALKSGNVRLTDDGTGNGELTAHLKGLLITGTGTANDGTTGPVTTVAASLFCGGDTTPFTTTATVPLSKKGNAEIDTTIPLPGTCLVPAILINPNGNTSFFIALDGKG
jgi:hypothetical protein